MCLGHAPAGYRRHHQRQPGQKLDGFDLGDRPPVLIPFFGFRIMVGMGLIMLAVSWFGNLLRFRGRLETTRWFLWGTFLAFPTGFIAILTGWFTAEVGRQPWVVYGQKAGRVGRAEEGRSYCCSQCLRATPVVEAE
jgi:cytochrome bd-type quinol oxidase subunit 1